MSHTYDTFDDEIRWRPQEYWDDGDTPDPVMCERCGIGEMRTIRDLWGSDADGRRGEWREYAECVNCEWDGAEEFIQCDECGRGMDYCECDRCAECDALVDVCACAEGWSD